MWPPRDPVITHLYDHLQGHYGDSGFVTPADIWELAENIAFLIRNRYGPSTELEINPKKISVCIFKIRDAKRNHSGYRAVVAVHGNAGVAEVIVDVTDCGGRNRLFQELCVDVEKQARNILNRRHAVKNEAFTPASTPASTPRISLRGARY